MRLTAVTSQEKIDFSELPVIIGRNSVVDIPLDDPMVPPLQCMISKSADGGTVLWNLREDFPLYVNGRRVTVAELSSGDILTIGQRRFVFSCEEAEKGLKHSGTARPKRAAMLANC
jgi:pSer/pThr/pTyr-binding forkhead associated (FHA) protein